MATAFSRSGESCIFGKCTAEVRFRVPEDTEERLVAKARESGFANVAEYMRMVVLIQVYGLDEVQRLQTQRLNVIAGKGS